MGEIDVNEAWVYVDNNTAGGEGREMDHSLTRLSLSDDIHTDRKNKKPPPSLSLS